LDESVIVKSEGNATLSIEFENDTLCWKAINDSFVNLELTGYSLSSLIESCNIHESNIDLSSGTITISNDSLFNSCIKAFHPQFNAASCEISGNWFNYTTSGNNTVITIEDYPNFIIEDNEIYYKSNHGIELFYSGLEEEGEHSIHDNTIRYTGLNGSSPEVGIHSYLSYVDIQLNRINNADYGIAGFHGSGLIVLGDSTADEAFKTQQIYNNRISQCIFSLGSFPSAFRWNIVGDTASLSDKPHIKAVNYDELIHDTTGVRDWEGDPEFDVTYNCWILNDTNPESRLLPVGAYTWRPIWCPGQIHEREMNSAEAAYYVAKANVESENYITAEEEFKELISDFPESIFAQASLKSLFAINRHIYGTSYSSFKSYCDSLSANPGDSLLGVTAGWLSIHCDIKDRHYQQAVNSLDSILSNPPSLEDSIYALIDLSYVFTKILDTTNQKSMLFSTHSELIPKTYKNYLIHREFWIEELLKSQQRENNPSELFSDNESGNISVKITSIYPNPASNSIEIQFEIFKEGTYYLMLYSLTGQIILKITDECSTPGTYRIHQDVSRIPSGIYFLALQNNRAILDSEKLVKSH
jgi:hypothetical protein